MCVCRICTEKFRRGFQDFCVEIYLRKCGRKFCVGSFDFQYWMYVRRIGSENYVENLMTSEKTVGEFDNVNFGEL